VFGLELSFLGERLDPRAVTRILGVAPSSTRSRCEGKICAWRLQVEGGSPSACVDALAGRFGRRLPDLSKLPGVEEGRLEVRVGLELGRSEETEVRLDWEPAALLQLAGCRLPLVVTFEVVGADRELLTEPPTDESVLF
jgi:hypothetical protein